MINGIIDSIFDRFRDTMEFINDPIWGWYAIAAMVFAAVLVVAYFLPFKWVRASLGGFLLLMGAFLAGGYRMHGEMKDKLQAERDKVKALKKDQGGGGFFGKW